jgi:hypothetical protein
MIPDELEKAIENILKEGTKTPLMINATVGSTVRGGFDDLVCTISTITILLNVLIILINILVSNIPDLIFHLFLTVGSSRQHCKKIQHLAPRRLCLGWRCDIFKQT